MTHQELPAPAGARQGTLAVIYAFRSPGSGAVYIGKHKCDCAGWPKRGFGRLPDGYKGSGRAVRRFHERHGEAVEWRVLVVVDAARDAVNAAERRAIRLARKVLGRKCANMTDGGDGWTSERSRNHWSDPKNRERISATHKALAQTPERSAYLQEAGARLHLPDVVARRRQSKAAWDASPEGKAYFAKAKARLRSPEVVARQRVSRNTFDQTEAGQDQLRRWRAAAQSPEARAKAIASLKAFDASPEGKAKRKAAAIKAAATRAEKRKLALA